jgi:hypothetical protein
MNVYCAHGAAAPYGSYGYMTCGLCGSEWYSQDPAPLVVIGVTSQAEVERYPFQRIEDEKEES